MNNSELDQLIQKSFPDQPSIPPHVAASLEEKMVIVRQKKQWKAIWKICALILFYNLVLFMICRIWIGATWAWSLLFLNMIVSVLGSGIIAVCSKEEYLEGGA